MSTIEEIETTLEYNLNRIISWSIPTLQEDVIFIAGGAIASLFIKEPPRDFDCYFTESSLVNRSDNIFGTVQSSQTVIY